jgi:hypothetical protein
MITALQNILETTEKKDDFWEGFERTVKKEEKRLLGLVADYKKQMHVPIFLFFFLYFWLLMFS